MNHTNTSNGWRWLGLIVLIIILLLLSAIGLGPSFSGSSPSCCGVPIAQTAPVPAPAAVEPAPVNLGLKEENGKVTLTGTVPSEQERQKILAEASAVYGAGNIIDQLTVSANAGLPGWWQNVGKALSWLKGSPNLGLSQLGSVLTLTGTVPSEDVKRAKESEMKALAGEDITVNNLLTVTAPVAANAPPEVPACGSDMNVTISFATNSAGLSEEGKKQLEEVAKCITSATEVGGHTDSDGSDVYNAKLSKARANAVIAYIKSIDKEKGSLLTAIGYGESKPVADNASEEGKAKNRRIEFAAK